MEFAWTEDQIALRGAVARLLDGRADTSANRALAEAGERYDAGVWRTLAEQIGAHGLAIPEDAGGSGGSLVELAIVFEEMGRRLYGGPFLASIGMAARALQAVDPASEHLGGLASGELTATVAIAENTPTWFVQPDALTTRYDGGLSGTKNFVLDGADADLIVVLAAGPDGPQWLTVEASADGVRRTPLSTLDQTRRMATIEFDGATAQPIGDPADAAAALAELRDTVAILLAAEQAGGAAAITAVTAEYARTRFQFGRPIGSFQGVKHRLADMVVRQEMSRSAAYWAAWQQPRSPEQALGARVARSYCSDAFLQTGKDAIQLHGGIGFTWEHDAHMYVRRARTDYSLIGDPAEYRRDLALTLAETAEDVA